MTPEELVGRRIAEIRERFGLTQQQLGERLEPLLGKPWPRQTVSAAEKGRRAFTAAELLAVAEVLDTWAGRLFTPTTLVGDDVEMPGGVTLNRQQLSGSRRMGDSTVRVALEAVSAAGQTLMEHSDSDASAAARLATLHDELMELMD